MKDGEKLGTILIQADSKQIEHRLKQYAGVALVVVPIFLAGAFLLSVRLQRLISNPILHLAETAKRVSHEVSLWSSYPSSWPGLFCSR